MLEETKRQRCQVMSRVCGWYSSISQWNKGKVSEWRDRLPYKVEKQDKE